VSSSWEIELPHRGDPAAPLLTVVDAARVALTGDARVIARQIALNLMTDGVGTVGAALERLEAASPAERRALLGDARRAAGLPSTAQVDRARRAAHRVEPIDDEIERDELGAGYQTCAADRCRAFPIDAATGAPVRHRARRWHCAAHAHLAAPGDLDDWTSSIVIGPAGLVDLEAQEAERVLEHLEDERRAAARAQRLAARAAELPAVEAEARAEALAWQSANLLPPERTP
jgi:hypothetical protein